MIKYNDNNIIKTYYGDSGLTKLYYHDNVCYYKISGEEPTPPTPTGQTLQWVTFSNGNTIPSDLKIYGIKGIVNDLSRVFDMFDEGIYVEDASRNKYNVTIGGYYTTCYSELDIISNTSVEYIFSNVGCSSYYTVGSRTIDNMSNDIQLLIYA